MFRKSIAVRTKINDSSSVIIEKTEESGRNIQRRVERNYSKERKSRKEKDNGMFEAMTECQKAEM